MTVKVKLVVPIDICFITALAPLTTTPIVSHH